MNKILLTRLLPVFLFCSCATTEKFEERLRNRMGQDINSVITSVGPPQKTFKMTNGFTVYTWHFEGSTTYSTQTQAWTGKKEIVTNSPYCDVNFTVDEHDKIINWQYNGNDCRSN